MKKMLILSFCAAGALSFSAFAAPAVKAPAAPVKAPAAVKPAVQVDPFLVLPEKVAEVYGKAITRNEFKSFLLSVSPEGKLPEQVTADFMKAHAYDLVMWCAMEKLIDQAQAEAKINLTQVQIKAMLKEQFDKMPDNLRAMMVKQLDMKGQTIDKYIDTVSSDPLMRKQINRAKFIENVVKDAKVSNAEVEKYYKDHAGDFMTQADTPETMRASHILIAVGKDSDGKKELARVNALLAQLKKDPAAFGKLAFENSVCPSGKRSNGSLGSFQKGMMVPEFEKAVLALKPGEISGAVKTQFGYHIIRRDMPQKAQQIPLKTVESDIRQGLLKNAQSQIWQKYVENLQTKAGVKILVAKSAPAAPAAPAAK